MSESILRAKEEKLLKLFNFLKAEKSIIKINDLDNFEKIITINKDFKEFEKEIIELINDMTYFSIGKLDIKLNGIDETMINKIVIFNIFNLL